MAKRASTEAMRSRAHGQVSEPLQTLPPALMPPRTVNRVPVAGLGHDCGRSRCGDRASSRARRREVARVATSIDAAGDGTRQGGRTAVEDGVISVCGAGREQQAESRTTCRVE
jgi:hypothetical protein